jgi:uncharacterized protein YndB with AHSA1/START domain
VPEFEDSLITAAPPLEVWRILYDPLRFAEWWSGFERVTAGDARGGAGDVTLWPEGYPDFALPQRVESHADEQRVVVSCTVSDLLFEWRLVPADGGTRITVSVGIPPAEAAREETQRAVVRASLRRLAELAAAESAVTGGSPAPG